MATDQAPAPFHIQHHGCQCDKIPRVPLFSWDDESPESRPTVFTMPEYFEAHVGLDYLEVLHAQGSDAALRWAALTAVGRDGWNALRSPGMDTEMFTQIMEAIVSKVRGSMRGPKGRLRSVT